MVSITRHNWHGAALFSPSADALGARSPLILAGLSELHATFVVGSAAPKRRYTSRRVATHAAAAIVYSVAAVATKKLTAASRWWTKRPDSGDGGGGGDRGQRMQRKQAGRGRSDDAPLPPRGFALGDAHAWRQKVDALMPASGASECLRAIPSREQCDYAAKYCEENVWKLCARPECRDCNCDFYAVFVSNEKKSVRMWSQEDKDSDPIRWDYHVFCVVKSKSWAECRVFDLDSNLEWGVHIDEYVARTFRDDTLQVASDLQPPLFRVVAAEDYLKTFASDRSHMRKENGKFQAEPPAWPQIFDTERGVTHNLHDFYDMTRPGNSLAAQARKHVIGDVVTLQEFRKFFQKAAE